MDVGLPPPILDNRRNVNSILIQNGNRKQRRLKSISKKKVRLAHFIFKLTQLLLLKIVKMSKKISILWNKNQYLPLPR
jgi:hypothetical protein